MILTGCDRLSHLAVFYPRLPPSTALNIVLVDLMRRGSIHCLLRHPTPWSRRVHVVAHLVLFFLTATVSSFPVLRYIDAFIVVVH